MNQTPCGNDHVYDEEMKRTFGDQVAPVSELLKKRKDISADELALLIRDPRGLSRLMELADERPDLGMSDFIVKSQDGKVRISWAIKDDYAWEVMEKRKDIKPAELDRLKESLVSITDDDQALLRELFGQASELLMKYDTLVPDELSALFMGITGKADFQATTSGSGDALLKAGKLEIIRASLALLISRPDLKTNRVAKLIRSTFDTIGDMQDKLSLGKVARSFSQICTLLGMRKTVSIDQARSHMSWMQQIIPGQEPGILEDRAAILSTACSLLKGRPNMDFDTATLLLIRITERKNAPKADAVLKEFNESVANLIKGYDLDEVAEPLSARQSSDHETGMEPL
ncbi:MAG: hypothetical protein AB2L14_36010 [Candidatus Xenobiia bacterium LiM19]